MHTIEEMAQSSTFYSPKKRLYNPYFFVVLIFTISVSLFNSIAWAGGSNTQQSKHFNFQQPYSSWNQKINSLSYRSTPYLKVAATENASGNMTTTSSKNQGADIEYENRLFTGNKVHQYLGVGSILMAGLTVIAPKEEDGPHEYLAKGSAAFGLLAVATGLAFHFDDISLQGGFDDPDNNHAIFGALGAVGLTLAASTGPDVPHATYGVLGSLSMLYAIKLEW